MPKNEIREIRESLGLNVNQLAAVLGITQTHLRKLELPLDRASHSSPSPTLIRLLRAYADGYRPKDWPV